MTRQVFLAWQDPERRSWHPIGRLQTNGRRFVFVYTRGAIEAQKAGRFAPLAAFADLHRVYQSTTIFPLFANRLMPTSRPDYANFLRWLDVSAHDAAPLVILARSGGQRATDTLEVFPCPEKTADGAYETRFFVHGLRHMPKESAQRAERLKPGDQLLLMSDFQNPFDANALALRTTETSPGDLHLLGYCPRYLRGELLKLMTGSPNPPRVTVERVNLSPAPVQFRILCHLRMKWADGFAPFTGDEYQPIVGDYDKVGNLQVA